MTRKSIFSGQTQYCYLECPFCVEKTFLMFFRHMNTIKMFHNYVIFYHLLQNFVIKIMRIDFRVQMTSSVDAFCRAKVFCKGEFLILL